MDEKKKMPFPLAFTLGIALLLTVGFLLTFSPTFAVAAVFCLMVAYVGNYKDNEPDRRKDAPAVRIICMLLAVGFLFLFPPVTISSNIKLQYPIQKAYIGIYQNVREPDWFPDFLRDVESDYHFEYMPAIMQGSGFYSVEFITTPERAAAYAEEYAAQARYTLKLSAYGSHTDSNGKDITDLTLYLGTGFWNGENAEIYVVSASLHPNHPHSSAVIIDRTTGKIQFTQYG